MQSILVHENAHAIADANAAVDDSFLRRFAGAVERLPSRFYKNIKNIIEESGYESHELYDEIFAVALQRMFQCPKVIERLLSELSSDDCEIFDNILTEQYNGKERYKETVIVGFKHRTDEETNINGLSREDVKNGEVLERNTGRLGRGYSDKSEVVNRQGDGYGAYSDEEVSYLNDPISIVLGKNRFSKKRQADPAARERQRMADRVQELAQRKNYHIDG